MKVLLVEPNYKNKYPPMGLMKISTYHKMLGDDVRFVKGLDPDVDAEVWDRIYVTTLFTFDFDRKDNQSLYEVSRQCRFAFCWRHYGFAYAGQGC